MRTSLVQKGKRYRLIESLEEMQKSVAITVEIITA
jgi:hypothetical protein